MFILSIVRRYHLPLLLFSLCLSASVFFTSKTGSNQIVVAGFQRADAQEAVISKHETQLSMSKDVRKNVLGNGLTVLTKEVHTTPVVSVQVWYRVGSRNEAPGLNGIAHQLEHMLFKGTTDRPIQFGRLFNALGSDFNAFTTHDKTAYFGTVEQNKLKAMLTLEADRMQNALIGEKQLNSEKRVVISELQGYENNPAYRLERAVKHAAFPHQPYGLTVGGTKSDVQKFTSAELQQYYHKYYNPNNATLVIVGDFQTEQTLLAVRDIFGKVPNRGTPETRSSSNSQKAFPITLSSDSPSAKTPIVLRQPGSVPLLQAVYPLPTVNDPDVPALDLMNFILTEGRSSRLYQSLVQSGLASDIGGETQNLIAGGWYQLSATAASGKKLVEIEQALSQALTDLRDKGVTAEELKRAKAELRANVILQNRDITNQATQLGNDQTIAGDYHYTDHYLAAFNQVSTADVQRVAKKYLVTDARTIGLFEPTQIAGKASTGAGGSMQTSEHFNIGSPVDPSELAMYLPPVDSATYSRSQVRPVQFSLANRLKVLLLPDHSTPTVTLTGYIQAGTEFDSDAKSGLASLTTANMMNGTKIKDALSISKTLADRGAALEFSAEPEGVTINGNALAPDLQTLIQVLSDVMQNATFPTNELKLSQQRALTALKVEMDTPSGLAKRKFKQAIYPENHPFHAFPTETSLKNITRADVVQFHQNHYQPHNTVLTLLGDFDPQQVRSLLEKHLGRWNATGKTLQLNYPSVQSLSCLVRFNAVLPHKTESITFMGYKGIDRKDPRYYAAVVLNEIVGGNTLSSRLGNEIRDRLGLTYGIYSSFQAGKHAGPFIIEMQTAPEDTQRAIASTLTLLQQIHNQGMSTAEVQAAQRSITSSYIVSLANPDDLASRILMNEVYGLGEDELRQFLQQIRAVTLAQVNQADKELIQPNKLVVVTAGPAESAVQVNNRSKNSGQGLDIRASILAKINNHYLD